MRILTLSIILFLSFNANAIISNDYFNPSQFLGSWSWETSTRCIETYTFKEGGVLQIKSGEELSDHEYQITKPEKTGQLAKLKFTTVKDYGGKDCASSTSDSTGKSAEMYIGITPDGKKMFNCDKPEGKDCWLLKKVKEAN